MNTNIGFVDLASKTMNSSVTVDDNSFGPFIEFPGEVTFDFTLLFEETILSILPSALFLLLVPPRFLRLWKTPRKVTGSYLQTIKITLLAIFGILHIVNVVEISRSSLRTQASVPAALLSLAAALGLGILSYAEHTRNIRPSSIINAYLLLSLSFDAAQLRTKWLRGDDAAASGVLSSIIAIKLLVLISEATEKRRILVTSYLDPSPEATSGLYSRGVFWWLNSLFRLGFRKVVSEDDLFAVDRDLKSQALATRFDKHWANRKKYPKKHTLIWVISRAMFGPFLAAMLPRIALTFFSFMQPLLISSITSLVSSPDSPSANSRGWGLAAAFGLVYVGLAIAGGAYQHKTNRMVTMIRGTLVNAVYSQTLEVAVAGLEESKAITLMSSDVERIVEAILPVHSIWSSPLEIGLAIWLLQREIGLALLGPLFITILAVSGPFMISGPMGKAQKIWIERIQARIDATAKMLQSIKGVKMLGLDSTLSKIVTQLRADEIAKSLRMRKLFVIMIMFGNLSDILAPGAAFTIYVIVAAVNGQTLDVTSAFTALSLIALLVAPIRAIVFAIPPLIAAVGCFDRIQDFLDSPTQKDHRILTSSAPGRLSSTAHLVAPVWNTPINSDIELEDITVQPGASSSSATIRVKNLTLSWSEDATPVIDDVSLDFLPKQLTMIVGPVGCGKSSLLRGLLGETPSSKGHVYIDRPHAAFVDQSSWIQNTSIRSNIVGISDFEPEWYNRVVYSCALDTDIEKFPDGDSTKVGSAGTALSGGQKLRIALARAVYSRQPVLMLDDVFSGLDATSEERIFSRLLGTNGLLRRLGTTIILVTHAAHRLSYADHIISLSPQGTISEQGKLSQLLLNDGYVAGLCARHTTESENVPEEKPLLANASEGSDPTRENATADLNRPAGNWSLYSYYFTSAGRRNVAGWAFLMICYSWLVYFPGLWIKFWTSAIAIHGNSINGLYLGVLLAVEFAALATLLILGIMLGIKMIPRSALYLHRKLLNTVENAPLSFFTATDSGEIVNRFSQDLSVIDMELPVAGLILAHNVCSAVIQAILICISTSYFAVVIPFVSFAVYILQKIYLRTSRQVRLMDLEAKAPLYTNFLETLSGLVTIRAFGWTAEMEKRNMQLLDASQRPFYLLFCIQRWLALVIDLLVAVLAFILIALIIVFRHRADAGFVGVALINIMTFNMTLSVVIQHYTAVETSLGAISRIQTFVRTTASEDLPQENAKVPAEWPSEGSLSISDLSATYSHDLDPALKHISLEIQAGQKLGICGPSGSGKSSFVSLLLHLLEIRSGTVVVDGIDLATVPRNVLRERMSVIPQDPVFFKRTIRENLDPLGLASAIDAENALRKVGIWEVITGVGGLDVSMNAEGMLSHGQRQMFCLARAMIRKSKILIVDEVTASVDLETDRRMQEIIAAHYRECTVITVAHRLQSIRDFDQVVVFEGGRVVEVGEPGKLLEVEGGKFRGLWNGGREVENGIDR